MHTSPSWLTAGRHIVAPPRPLSVVLLLTGLFLGSQALGQHFPEDQRPPGLDGSNWQFGPHNRWAYSHMSEVLTSKMISSNPKAIRALPGRMSANNELSVDVNEQSESLAVIMQDHYIDGLMALVDGTVVLEKYAGTLTPDRTHLLWSVSKTITGLIAASVEADGLIDLNNTVAHYVPELAASGWGSDTLRDVLDMRDGSDWTEDYAAPNSTVRRQDCADGLLTGPDCKGIAVVGNYAFLPKVGRDESRKGRFVYKSGSTDVIAWVLEAATGKRFADLVSERLWQPIGAERDAGIAVDTSGFTLASGGMHATLADVARVGQLMLDRGQIGDTQVIPSAWMDDIFERDGSRSWPWPSPDSKPYYRSFVWGLGDKRGTVMAQGVHGQAIFVAPESGVVIVMLSSWPDAEGNADLGVDQQLALFKSIESALTKTQ